MEERETKGKKVDGKSILLAVKYALRNRIAAEAEFESENTLLLKLEDGTVFRLTVTETT